MDRKCLKPSHGYHDSFFTIKHKKFNPQLQIFHIYELSITSIYSRAQCGGRCKMIMYYAWGLGFKIGPNLIM